MSARRVHHWKHGWIPLDAYARGVAAKKGVRKVPQLSEGTTLDRVKGQRSIPAVDRIVAARARENARLKAAGIAHREEVDGVRFDTYDKYQDTLDLPAAQRTPHRFTREQQIEIASVVNEFKRNFPKMQPVTVVGDEDPDKFGVTEWDGRRITLSAGIFDPDTIERAHRAFGDYGAIIGPYSNNEYAFRRAVITHEMGHALQMQQARVQIQGEKLAEKKVTPRDLGYSKPTTKISKTVNLHRSEAERVDALMDQAAPRWKQDTLNGQTIYGLQNEWEWFAEAFADGYLHGDNASPAGKEVLDLIKGAYA